MLLAVGIAAVVLGYVFVSSLRAPRRSVQTVATPSALASLVPSPSPSPVPAAGPSPSSAPPKATPSVRTSGKASPSARPTASGSPRPSPAAGHTDPVAVATGFVMADQTWTWSDLPDPNVAARTRAAAWSTPGWIAVMSQSSSAAYLTQQRVAAHEVDTVVVNSVVQQDPSTATSKTELVLSTVTVTKDGATPSPRSGYLQLTVVQQADGSWAVDNATA